MVTISRIGVCLHTQTTPDSHPTTMIPHTKYLPLSALAINVYEKKKRVFHVGKVKESAVRKVNRPVCQPVNILIINRETKSDKMSVLLRKIVTKVRDNKDTDKVLIGFFFLVWGFLCKK